MSEFTIENYNNKRPFASFLPGIAGLRGKPIWAFYVNRGQCMASFGTRDKNGAIMEFYPANTAYRRTPLEGFRTFIKLRRLKGKEDIYEPFRLYAKPQKEFSQKLRILPHEFSIEEISKKHSLKTEVIYFTIPNDDFPALARILRIENLSSRRIELEIIDGIAKMCPFGTNELFMKHMSRTIEAWIEVEGLSRKMAFYRLKVNPEDVSRVEYIKAGNFYLSITDQKRHLDTVADPYLVFGDFDDFTCPGGFLKDNFKIPKEKKCGNITPSAFSYARVSVLAKNEHSILSLIGYAESFAALERIKKKINKKFFEDKRIQNRLEIEKISSSVSVFSGLETFDAYVNQTNLDNILRGGYPIKKGKKIIYVFNRKHGDLERDYNNFVLNPEFYSQGNGNFRDMNQNRRNSVWVNPDVGIKDIKDFYNLIQLDGFNPLVIKPNSNSRICAEHKEGYWIDHWTYNLDLVESYLALFPERSASLFFKDKDFMFFDSPYRVKPRNARYVKDRRGTLRQYDSVYLDREKEKLIDSRKTDKTWVRTKNGKGRIYRCSLATKIMTIIANKVASLDSRGRGMEMEADKPGWCDSLNGLPAIMGSSICETIELLRLVEFFIKVLTESTDPSVYLPVEVSNFLEGLKKELKKNHNYWDNSNALKENYREKVRFGLNGKEKKIDKEGMLEFLRLSAEKLKDGIKRSKNKKGIPYTYFANKRPLPLFLEGPTHLLKIEKDKSRGLSLYNSIRRSKLYDKKLKMYKLNEPLDGAPLEIGRSRIFTPGWLENESIWLHMEYKYLLEVLRSGLYGQFYDDFKCVLIPFQNPQRYGRSILENSSFIVSSRFADHKLWGRGFVARLTGASAEFLHILRIMNLGENPFLDINGKLIFSPHPILHKELFTKKERTIEFGFKRGKKTEKIDRDSYAFSLFTNTLVIYNNPKRKNTFGRESVKPIQFTVLTTSGKKSVVKAHQLEEPFSTDLREGKIEKISILLQ